MELGVVRPHAVHDDGKFSSNGDNGPATALSFHQSQAPLSDILYRLPAVQLLTSDPAIDRIIMAGDLLHPAVKLTVCLMKCYACIQKRHERVGQIGVSLDDRADPFIK